MNKEKVEAKLFKKIDNTYVEITKEQLIISLQEANKSLEQENQQLKEEIKWYEKENKHNQEIIVKDTNILTELEEWLNKQLEDTIKCLRFSVKNNNKTFVDMYSRDRYLYKMNVDKIQELKEKYK